MARESALRKQHQIGQKQSHEYVEHVEVAELEDAGLVELSGAEASVGPQHRQEHLPRTLLVVVHEIHLRQNLQQCAASGFDHANVVPRVEPSVPDREHRAVSALLVRLILEGELL